MAKTIHEDQLHKIFDNVNNWLKFAEAKNLGLLTVNSAIIFGVSKFGNSPDVLSSYSYWVLTFFLIMSSLVCLSSLMPVLELSNLDSETGKLISQFNEIFKKEIPEPKDDEKNIYYYGHIKFCDGNKFEKIFIKKTSTIISLSDSDKDLVAQITMNSRISWTKYSFFKTASYLTLMGIFLSIFTIALIFFFKHFCFCI